MTSRAFWAWLIGMDMKQQDSKLVSQPREVSQVKYENLGWDSHPCPGPVEGGVGDEGRRERRRKEAHEAWDRRGWSWGGDGVELGWIR